MSGKNETWKIAEHLEEVAKSNSAGVDKFIEALGKHYTALIAQRFEQANNEAWLCKLCNEEHNQPNCIFLKRSSKGGRAEGRITINGVSTTAHLSDRQFKIGNWAKSIKCTWYASSAKMDLRSVPWLLNRASSTALKGMTVSHSCHNEDCFEPSHTDVKLTLSSNQGLNDCAPCVCHHIPICTSAGRNFIGRMSEYSTKEIEAIRKRRGIAIREDSDKDNADSDEDSEEEVEIE